MLFIDEMEEETRSIKQQKYIIKASYMKCPLHERKLFNKSHCIMPISVGSPVHEGGKMKATLKLVNRSFKRCSILIDDTLQRFTLQIADPTLTEKTAYEQAMLDGETWLSRNKNYISNLQIDYRIIRWDDWLNHPLYPEKYSEIEYYYINNSDFKSAITLNIDQYLSRRKINSTHYDYLRASNVCLNYLKEECAVMCLWPLGQYDFELYPHGRNTAMQATYEQIIKHQYPNLLKEVALRFKKYINKLNMDLIST